MRSDLIFAAVNAALYARNRDAIRRYRSRLGRFPNIANPGTYAERMLWRKLVDHNPQFVMFCDKLAAKAYCQACPDVWVPDTLWVGHDADAIPDAVLRGDVYVKANHGCNFNYRVSGGKVDRHDLKRSCDEWLAQVFGAANDEWAYWHITPQLFVEEAIGDAARDLIEIHFRAGNGRVILGSVIGHNKLPNVWRVFLDPEGRPVAGPHHIEGTAVPQLPAGLDVEEPYRLAVRQAEQLSVGVDYARFDFMWNGRTLYANEITVYPQAGSREIENPTVHDMVLRMWDLTTSHFLTTTHHGAKRLYADALRRELQQTRRTEPRSQ